MTPSEGARAEVVGTLLAKLRLAAITRGLTADECQILFTEASDKIRASHKLEKGSYDANDLT
jgi:hypothetical protein